jgi:hypothetical protein
MRWQNIYGTTKQIKQDCICRCSSATIQTKRANRAKWHHQVAAPLPYDWPQHRLPPTPQHKYAKHK